MMFDHMHNRSQTSEDIKNTQSEVVRRHESFTLDEAKVIVVYGVKVPSRLLETRELTFLPL